MPTVPTILRMALARYLIHASCGRVSRARGIGREAESPGWLDGGPGSVPNFLVNVALPPAVSSAYPGELPTTLPGSYFSTDKRFKKIPRKKHPGKGNTGSDTQSRSKAGASEGGVLATHSAGGLTALPTSRQPDRVRRRPKGPVKFKLRVYTIKNRSYVPKTRRCFTFKVQSGQNMSCFYKSYSSCHRNMAKATPSCSMEIGRQTKRPVRDTAGRRRKLSARGRGQRSRRQWDEAPVSHGPLSLGSRRSVRGPRGPGRPHTRALQPAPHLTACPARPGARCGGLR